MVSTSSSTPTGSSRVGGSTPGVGGRRTRFNLLPLAAAVFEVHNHVLKGLGAKFSGEQFLERHVHLVYLKTGSIKICKVDWECATEKKRDWGMVKYSERRVLCITDHHSICGNTRRWSEARWHKCATLLRHTQHLWSDTVCGSEGVARA